MKIIVTTDFSSNADKALNFALENFQNEDVEYILLHSVHARYAGASLAVDLSDELEEEGREKLSELASKVSEGNPNLKITALVKSGPLANVLVNFCEEENPDMVVMGTNGTSGLYERMIGSNTEEVMNLIDFPLLVVPHNCEIKKIEIIEVAIDKAREDLKAVEYCALIGKKLGASVHVLHLLDESKPAEPLDIDPGVFEGNHFALVQIQTKKGETDNLIQEFEQKDNADLIAVIPHHKTFLKSLFHTSVSENLLMESEKAVLIL